MFDDIDFIKNSVEFIQFEHASTWFDRIERVSLKSIYDTYKDVFSFYFLYDPNHPVSSFYQTLLTPIDSDSRIVRMEEYAGLSFGANIVMLKQD